MGYYIIKLFISSAIIVVVSEVAKYNVVIGGLIKSLPLVSLLALIWLYADTHDTAKAAALSTSTFWFVLPTLPMFLIFPALIRRGLGFYPSLSISIVAMLVFYLIALGILRYFKVGM